MLICEVLDYEARNRNVLARRDEYDFGDTDPGDEFGSKLGSKLRHGR